MSDKASTFMSLQAIRAKLLELKMQQPNSQWQPEQKQTNDTEFEELSLSNSFESPMSTQHIEIDLSNQSTTSSLHLPERETDLSSQNNSLQLSGFLGAKQPSSVLQWQRTLRSNLNPAGWMQAPGGNMTGSFLSTSSSRTGDLTDRSLSSHLHQTDSMWDKTDLENEVEQLLKVPSVYNSRAPAKAKESLAPVHSNKCSEASLYNLGIQEQKPQRPLQCGRISNQNTEEFKVPKPAAGYIDFHMGMGHSNTVSMTSEEKSVTDQPLFTHPSSTGKHSHPSSTWKHSLRHFSSTPDMCSSASNFGAQELKINRPNLGMPMRVRIQQHPVHLLSDEREDDSDLLNSIKPLSPTRGRFASLASSGSRSDTTISTEHSMPDLPPSSEHRSLSLTAATCNTAEDKTASSSVHRHSQHGSAGVHCGRHSQRPVSSQVQLAPSSLSAAFAPPPVHGGAPVVCTPADKGLQKPTAVMHTPSSEAMETVTVNGEQYCVLKKVGRGGSAQVYRVLDAEKNIRALKVVDFEGAGTAVVDGFRNEIHLLQRLQYCPSVIKMFNFELNQQMNCLYVVLEYGETDLSEYFTSRAKQAKGLAPNLIKFYWQEMLQAVSALHKEGVIHSDLKPANFMLVAGNLKLIDFGISNTLQQDKTSVLMESRVGTPSYMSPEAIMAACEEDSAIDKEEQEGDKENQNHQHQHKSRPKFKVGVRSDVWSLGCILYYMVYGRTPFQQFRNNMAKLQAITNPNVPISFPPLPTPDPHLMDVLQKCLKRDIRSRPTTAELLAHPYVTNQDMETESIIDSKCRTPPKVLNIPSTATTTDASSTESVAALEARRLQELLKSQLAVGSPGIASALSRVVDELQKLESGTENKRQLQS